MLNFATILFILYNAVRLVGLMNKYFEYREKGKKKNFYEEYNKKWKFQYTTLKERPKHDFEGESKQDALVRDIRRQRARQESEQKKQSAQEIESLQKQLKAAKNASVPAGKQSSQAPSYSEILERDYYRPKKDYTVSVNINNRLTEVVIPAAGPAEAQEIAMALYGQEVAPPTTPY